MTKLALRTVGLFSCCLLLASALIALAKDKTQDAAALIASAVDKTNLFALPSFEIKAELRVENNGRLDKGTYLFQWNGPAAWREEIDLPGYHEVQVGGDNVVFRKRSTDFFSWRIKQLHATLGYGTVGSSASMFARMGLRPGEVLEKGVHERNRNGQRLSCVEIAYPFPDFGASYGEGCIDKSTGTFVRGGWSDGRFADESAMPAGTKMYPRVLRYVEKKKTIVEVRITELNVPGRAPPSTFEPPSNSTAMPGCMNPQTSAVIKRPLLEFPLYGNVVYESGKVEVYAIIDPDGIPRQLRAVGGRNLRMTDASIINYVQEWRFSPATCNGHSVPFETVVLAP